MTDKVSAHSKTTRRRVLQGATASMALAGMPASAFAQRSAGRPNILFILADDLGYADISCYGARGYRTPVLDQLAAEGLLMTHGYANSPVCSATRIALITGRYQYRLRAGLEEPIGGRESNVGLSPSVPTLPALLKGRGYRTALIGKWHMGWPPEYGAIRSGYDRFFGIAGGATNYFTHRGADRNTAGGVPFNALYEGAANIERPGYLTDLLADRAIEEIEAGVKAGQPTLVSLHFTAPHSPWQGPGDAVGAEAIRSNVQFDGGSLEKYGEMVVAMDRAIGRVLAALDRAGAAEDTIVVFTSDNGGERFSDTWPFSGGKRKLLEGGIRVPMIVRWPGRVKAGSRSSQVMISMDWLPTLLEAAGAAPASVAPPDGMSLLKVIAGGAPAMPRKLYWRFKTDDQAAVREGNWKYLRRRGREYLFNVAVDPRERANLKGLNPGVFERLKQDWAAWNATMLPYPKESFSAGGEANSLADD